MTPAVEGLEGAVLERITPDPDEERRVEATVAALLADCERALQAAGLPGRPSVQGSIAKGTWLAGGADVDCFLLMEPDLDPERLKQAVEAVGKAVLDEPRKKYAQHPYLIGRYGGLDVDLVPAYAVPEASSHMSAVDRTPFHTRWVAENLDGEGRAQVRLLKRWCKGVGLYGAETAVGGFSGYLLEVLVHHLAGFHGVLDWFANGCRPRRIATGADEVEDDVSPLVVVDPVDPGRNCAAAVQEEMLERAKEAAQAYLADPSEPFYFPAPPAAAPEGELRSALAEQGAAWLGLLVAPRTDRLDIVLPQFQRTARAVAQALQEAGFPVRRHDVQELDDGARVAMQWVVDDVELPSETVHSGPPADVAENAERFRAKWNGHADAVDGVHEEGGRLVVRLRVRQRTPGDWLRANATRLLTAKHVRAAYEKDHAHLDDPAGAPPAWAPRVADVVLDRRPWQRP